VLRLWGARRKDYPDTASVCMRQILEWALLVEPALVQMASGSAERGALRIETGFKQLILRSDMWAADGYIKKAA